MLVLGVAESEAVENVDEKRELELEDRWKMPRFTMFPSSCLILPIADCWKSFVLTKTLIRRYTGYSSIHQMRSKRFMEGCVRSLTVLYNAEGRQSAAKKSSRA
jgi:hypothetical protein